MEKIQLSILCKIIGIGSASGLVFNDGKLFIISDTSTFLYQYSIGSQKLEKIPLLELAEEKLHKGQKPDFECISLNDNEISILGSGSAENRQKMIRYNIKDAAIKEFDLAPVYAQIRLQHNISEDELNIEGFAKQGHKTYYFQRGNGPSGKNGIFYTESGKEIPAYAFVPFDLPKIKNVACTFTDALILEGKIYFLASAEDSQSTYHDGVVTGSIIGRIDIGSMKLEKYAEIGTGQKFEGLTLYSKDRSKMEFLLCEDIDSEINETFIYKLTLHESL